MWATTTQARETWPDAPADDDVLTGLLDAAYEQVAAYAPYIVPNVIPQRYVQANVLQARELWTAARRDGDVIGFDAYAVRVRPLSATVKALLRPPGAVPRVG